MESLWHALWCHTQAWAPLPDWARFFAETGEVLGKRSTVHGRLRIAVVVPTRGYAAALTAAGVVVHRAMECRRPTADQHFARMCAMAPGAAVQLRHRGRVYAGVLLGCGDFSDGVRLGVQIESEESGGLRHWIGTRDAWCIEPAVSVEKSLLPHRQAGRRIPAGHVFAAAVLGPDAVSDFISRTELEVLLVGHVALIESEATYLCFGTMADDHIAVEGSLGELLRIRRLVGEGIPFRSDLIPIHQQRESPSIGEKAHTVVLDGAAAYLKWAGHFASSHTVTFLDRTDPACRDAASAFNRRFVTDRISDHEISLPKPPAGVEVLSYVEGP
ncbi:MAG TPA: hypothetical protein VJU82_09610 [Acidobacteriaceae bacterium]|nr:hypothetical protein [Acidobacteriaceae bacterium]